MSANWQKTWLADSLNQIAQGKAQGEIQRTGRALPCSVIVVSGGIVTVKFEVQSSYTLHPVTVPKIGSQWMRYPTQVGDLGMVIAADAYLGGVSGLGGGVADLRQRGNLSTLVYVPIGNTAWPTVNPNAVVLYGPDGVVLRDQGSACTFTLTPAGITINVSAGGAVAVNGGTVTVTGGDVIADGISLKQHVHPYTPGTGASTDTGVPVG